MHLQYVVHSSRTIAQRNQLHVISTSSKLHQCNVELGLFKVAANREQ